MLKGQSVLLRSSAGACLIAACLAIPSFSFAEGQTSWQTTVSGLLNNLDDVRKTYGGISGSVADMPLSGLEQRDKAGLTLQLIRANVLQAAQSDKVAPDLVQNTLTAIEEAKTALETESAQTIAWSLATVGQQVNAIEASYTGQPLPQGATLGRPAAFGDRPVQQTASGAVAPQDRQARTEAEQRTGVVPNEPQGPNESTQRRIEDANADAKAGAEPSSSNALASMKPDDLVGKKLYDKNGAEVETIEAVRMSAGGKIAAVDIDVGGFLGIGSRRVPVPIDDLSLNGNRIQSSMTADQIRTLPHAGQ